MFYPLPFLLAISLPLLLAAQKQPNSGVINTASLSYSNESADITVGSSLSTDGASSWLSPSGRFAFGFFHEGNGFFVGVQLFVSPSETVVVWTARPDMKPFQKGAFLNFTSNGFFVTPAPKGTTALLLFSFSSTATSAAMLDNGNFVVYSSNSSIISETSMVSLIGNSTTVPCSKKGASYYNCRPNVPANPYGRSSCIAITRCRPGSSSSSSNQSSTNSTIIIWRSFNFPTDTILGSQFLPCGYNLTSSVGAHILMLQCGGDLVFYAINSSDEIWSMETSGDYYNSLILDEDGRLYLSSSGGNEKSLSRYKPRITPEDMLYRATLESDNIFRLYAISLDANSSKVVDEIPYYKDQCQAKDICGANSYCLLANNNPDCHCLPGFEYIDQETPVGGCQRRRAVPSCQLAASPAADLSMEAVDNIVGLDELAYGVTPLANKDECSSACLEDCDCQAAFFVDQRCSKLKLPLTGGRKDANDPSVAFIKLAGAGGAGLAAVRHRKRVVRMAAIIISTAISVMIWILVITAFGGGYWLLFGRFRERWRRWEMVLTEEVAPRYFSHEEIFKGPNESKPLLGIGGQGTVFRADLPIGGKTTFVAVKQLHGAEVEGERDFQAEMRLIGRAHHKNLVRLLGFCHDGPCRLLVYEYMSRGSLADHIFKSKAQPSWGRRMGILLGAARGIQYLHRECETKIIHRDIKPENILIAEDWTAKISDFGLAKLLKGTQTRAATRTLAAGTEGYVAPECEKEVDGVDGAVEVTEKADVYSYGIVVLETICSKRNREAHLMLCESVRRSYDAGELWKLVDGEQVEAVELERVLKVGMLCVQADPVARPFMEEVVMMLEEVMDVPDPPAMPLPVQIA